MIENINRSFQLLAKKAPARKNDIAIMKERFGAIPEDYLELIQEATELEILHENGSYIRIWAPSDCVSMDEGYKISERIVGAIPIGDDGGGRVLFYMNGASGPGLYIVGYGDLDANDATWISLNLYSLMLDATGVNSF